MKYKILRTDKAEEFFILPMIPVILILHLDI